MKLRRDKYGNQILTGSDLIAFNGFKNSARGNSAMTPPAQTSGRCDNGTDVETLTERVRNIVEGKTDAPKIVAAVLEILFINGCRISEAIDITGAHITKDGKILSATKKGSNQRILVSVIWSRYWQSLQGMKERISDIYDRYWFYRQLKKYGVYMDAPNSTKKAVTHSLRHLYIKNTKNINISNETISREVGHKSKKSITYYEQKRNKE